MRDARTYVGSTAKSLYVRDRDVFGSQTISSGSFSKKMEPVEDPITDKVFGSGSVEGRTAVKRLIIMDCCVR